MPHFCAARNLHQEGEIVMMFDLDLLQLVVHIKSI